MQDPDKGRVEEKLDSYLWVDGTRHRAHLIWVSQSHAEIVTNQPVTVAEDQLLAVLACGCLSLPMRSEAQSGRHIVMRFVQRPHQSVLAWLDRELVKTETRKVVQDALEETAKPEQAASGRTSEAKSHEAGILLTRALESHQRNREAA